VGGGFYKHVAPLALGKAAVNAPQSRRSARFVDVGNREAFGVRVALAPLSDKTLLAEE
jgi:hypothetical protein